MVQTFDWNRNRLMWIRVLLKQTGEGLDAWNTRIAQHDFTSEAQLRPWLEHHGVTGYARQLLVMERFGYPDFLRVTGDELISSQFADRPQLRPIYDAIIGACRPLGSIAIQARKTYTSLLTPRRTFARLQPTTRTRLDVALRLEDNAPSGRLRPSKIHPTMPVQVGLQTLCELDAELISYLERAYAQNC